MFTKLSSSRRQLVDKTLLGLINLGNIAWLYAMIVSPFAFFTGSERFLNPNPPPLTAIDNIAHALMIPFAVLPHLLVLGAVSAIIYSFLPHDRKDRWIFLLMGCILLTLIFFLWRR